MLDLNFFFFTFVDIIEELISTGHQLDAINFAYEAGLQDKFPPIPLLKSFLEDSKKATSTSEDRNNYGQTAVCLVLLELLVLIKFITSNQAVGSL